VSRYEDYDRTSQNYDTTRQPVAVDAVATMLGADGGGSLAGISVLDAGCGTGQFTVELVRRGAQVEAVELSTGMITAARRKLQAECDAGQVRFQQASIVSLPLEDGCVDGAVINQVLHHLPEPAPGVFPVAEQVLTEVRRVLRPGGTLVVNTCSQAQLRDGFWYFQLMPERVRTALRQTYASLPALTRCLHAAGFASVSRVPVLDQVLAPDHYHQADGPLSEAWRDGDSSWALLTADELEGSIERAQALHDEGALEGFRDRHDAARRAVGQVTLVVAR
jgi:ubiquinone/menaquinone biosynthesis C-methylase UbiE